jgi:hypothetical protein
MSLEKPSEPSTDKTAADQVRTLRGETSSDLPAHRMPRDDEFLAGAPGSNRRLDVCNVTGGRIGACRYDIVSAMPAQIGSDETILALEQRQLPTPIVRIAAGCDGGVEGEKALS